MPDLEEGNTCEEETLEMICDNFRGQVGEIGGHIKSLMGHKTFDGEQMFNGQHSEMRANIMLTFRHLEDARMRLGKVMQQIQGGVSILDKMKENKEDSRI